MAGEEIIIVATFVAKPGDEKVVREMLLALIRTTKKEPGYIQYDLHQSIQDPCRFVFYEIWQDRATFALHANSDVMQKHRAKIAGMLQFEEVIDCVKLPAPE